MTVEAQARVMVLELDGVLALSRPEMGSCAGMEIKSAVLYPAASPSRRWMLAELADSAEFLPWLKGLLARGLKTGHDTLLGLGDGANWVENAFDEVGALPITDVYHSAQYLERVMIALGWSESRREWQRRAWCRGEVAAREWLEQRLPAPDPKSPTLEWLLWEPEAIEALRYLEKRLDSMDYPSFRARGFPIGSGQVEGMNKSVIGNRLKRSGRQWSREGAARMASLRAQVCAWHSLINFESLRHQAYPPVPT